MRCASFGLSVAVAAAFGCTSLEIDYQRLPTPEALESIREGITTRSEVLQHLGPPEEFRQPSPFDRARLTSPQRRRILEGREVFVRDVFSYVSERYAVRTFGLPPIGPGLLRISWRNSREDRWRLEFDERGLVETVSRSEESTDEDR